MSVSSREWVDVITSEDDPERAWKVILTKLVELALESTKTGQLDRATVVPDRLLANAAWNLWSEFPRLAPLGLDELKRFWVQTSPWGTAVLILDVLSLRELPHIVAAAKKRDVTLTRVSAYAAPIPTETNSFAAALGLPGRSKLANNQAPASFIFSGPDVSTNVLSTAFEDCASMVSAKPRVFLWHEWPDDALIHHYGSKADGPETVATQAAQQLASQGFWDFVNRLRQGRRLIITSDHGYAVSRSFSDEIRQPEMVQRLRDTFGAQRCADENPMAPWHEQNLPPLVLRQAGQLMVMGQRKWAVQGGFPSLCHGGLSLLEAVVPFIEFPAI